MVFNLSTGLQDAQLNSPEARINNGFLSSGSNAAEVLAQPDYGTPGRQMLHWRVPHLGWVRMFINPAQMEISESKDISDVRTKGGFILQYAGESLTKISISGTTGSAGVEGINILREIYRAEQGGFEKIAAELDRTGPNAEGAQISKGIFDGIANQAAGSSGNAFANFAASAASDFLQTALNPNGQPFPTLASLAVNIEMYFQGLSYRGYFKDLTVTESAERPGIFEYRISFVAHSRAGVRRNFMPWHRQPFNPIGLSSADANPLSFIGLPPDFVNSTLQDQFPDQVIGFPVSGSGGRRSTSVGGGQNGSSLTDIDLEDLI